ncbi:hypothetical protein [Sphingobacterium deserti]|uniref:DoxX family protein n=1 Tax=Sphingobacterium deserti TaxID=1229276 RepID=A0A0B8SZ96_9SPHI|nr:hypothetical protein [Sphingobacterium deserti]KGE12716.1 hypothetical protein DI53_3455 [Sphingobacterium deserti]
MFVIEKITDKDVPKEIDRPLNKSWPFWQLLAFRISLVFFIILSIPNNPLWYQHVLSIDWLNLDYRDLYDICRFGSGVNWFGRTTFGSRLEGYSIWVNTLFFSAAAGLLWSFFAKVLKKERKEYTKLYYWLNVIVRYRTALGIIGFGFTKLFPVQMPYPSLGILDTDYGDLTTQKIFWLSFGIVPWYQVFAGIVEVGAGTLLFFRKTVAIGSTLLVGALGAIVVVNFAYDGGVHVYSSYFVLLSLFLLVPYFKPFYDVFIREIPAKVNLSFPKFNTAGQLVRFGLKGLAIFLFLGVFFYLQYVDFLYDPYKQPSSSGVADLRGNYNVSEFKINGIAHPFDPYDSIRWQSATFEKWSTLTFKVNRPLKLDLSNGGGDPKRDVNRTFEISGVAGGQRAFHYYVDPKTQTLYLEDKYKLIPDQRNVTAGEGGDGGVKNYLDRLKKDTAGEKPSISLAEWIPTDVKARLGDEAGYVHPRARTARRLREFAKADQMAEKEIRQRFILSYKIEDDENRVVLTGIDENRDSLYVVLHKVRKDYKISPGKLDAGQYNK